MKPKFLPFLLMFSVIIFSLFGQSVEKLEIDGAIKIDNTTNLKPDAGTIRWNPATEDFEGYNGYVWKSLTIGNSWQNSPTTNIVVGGQKRMPADAAEGDFFGGSLAISGDYAIIGAFLDDDNGDKSGSAYIFVRSGTSWVEQAKLTASDGAANDYFGQSVSISGDYAIVSAYQDDDDGSDSGSAYIFIRSGNNWSEQAKLTASDADAGDLFGISVSISGDYAVIGAYLDDDGGTDSGSAYVFVRSGTSWTEQAKLSASDGDADDAFGFSVSISGDYVIAGAYLDDNSTNSGSAYVFARSGTTWSEQAKLTSSDGAFGDNFGESVAISGDFAAISASYDDDNGMDSGSAYVFARSGTTWTEQAKLTSSDGNPGDLFGLRLSISQDYIVLGAHRDSDNMLQAGSAYVFVRSGTNWSERVKFTACDGEINDFFGFNTAVSGDYIIISANGDDDNGTNSGSVYFFK
ncbi:MAG: FG-GAP repeat protein [Lewinellaceae bacterium]|nr:FG-GAP repeat protein [Lewinellaceae bacterium]